MTKLPIVIVVIYTLFLSCNNSNKPKNRDSISGNLIVFHAGSLAIPFRQMAKEFEIQNPSVNILLESSGSVKCARKITDLDRKCDIMASSDYSIIDEILIPEFASWNIKFASNEMCIVYHDASAYSNLINKDNWYNLLLKDDVSYGRSDPNSDPCGYRAVMVSKLAESFYSKPKLSKYLLAKDNRYIRPKEVDLLALLETNTIDYIFLYRSVAQQHGLKYLILPDEINLKNTHFTEQYHTAKVDIAGKKPGLKITKHGEPMAYGITIPDMAPNRVTAIAFIRFILQKDKGVAIMERNGQPSMVPSVSNTYKNIPVELQEFATTVGLNNIIP